MQGGADALGQDWSGRAVHRGRLRVRTLVTLRWLVVAGEALLLLTAMGMGLVLPYPLAFAVAGASAWVNLLTGLSPGQRVFGDREAAAQLSIDILQISALIFLTGGAAHFLEEQPWGVEAAQALAARIPDRSRREYETGAPDGAFKRRLNAVLMGLSVGLLCLEWIVRRLVKLA